MRIFNNKDNNTKNLWKRWTVNCAAGELAGIAVAGAIAYFVNTAFGEPQKLNTKLIVLAAMLLAGFFEGTILSFFQWRVLVTKFRKIPKKEWMFYTVAIAVLGWLLGMLPSLFFMPEQIDTGGETGAIDFSNPVIFALLSIGVGLVLGSLFGLFQWFSLRKYAEKAYQWIIANALGWGLGLGWIYLFASFPTESSSIWFNILMGLMGGILAGLSVGAVTGYYLVRLKPTQN